MAPPHAGLPRRAPANRGRVRPLTGRRHRARRVSRGACACASWTTGAACPRAARPRRWRPARARAPARWRPRGRALLAPLGPRGVALLAQLGVGRPRLRPAGAPRGRHPARPAAQQQPARARTATAAAAAGDSSATGSTTSRPTKMPDHAQGAGEQADAHGVQRDEDVGAGQGQAAELDDDLPRARARRLWSGPGRRRRSGRCRAARRRRRRLPTAVMTDPTSTSTPPTNGRYSAMRGKRSARCARGVGEEGQRAAGRQGGEPEQHRADDDRGDVVVEELVRRDARALGRADRARAGRASAASRRTAPRGASRSASELKMPPATARTPAGEGGGSGAGAHARLPGQVVSVVVAATGSMSLRTAVRPRGTMTAWKASAASSTTPTCSVASRR